MTTLSFDQLLAFDVPYYVAENKRVWEALNHFLHVAQVRDFKAHVTVVPIIYALQRWLLDFDQNMRDPLVRLSSNVPFRLCYAEQGMKLTLELFDALRNTRKELEYFQEDCQDVLRQEGSEKDTVSAVGVEGVIGSISVGKREREELKIVDTFRAKQAAERMNKAIVVLREMEKLRSALTVQEQGEMRFMVNWLTLIVNVLARVNNFEGRSYSLRNTTLTLKNTKRL